MILTNRSSHDIEEYEKILCNLFTLSLEAKAEFSINHKLPLLRPQYEEIKKEVEDNILQLFDKVNFVDELSVALFIYRSVTKTQMYKDNFEYWTYRFKICNYLFFVSLKYLKDSKCTHHVIIDDRQIIKELFLLGYTFFENQILFNEQHFNDNKNETNTFFEIVDQISSKKGDMHSYKIANIDLKKYLDMNNINIEKIRENALGEYKDQYITRSELSNNIFWKMLLCYNINDQEQEDDIIIIPTQTFNEHINHLQSFFSNFEAGKCKNPSEPEAELIFSYKTDNYFFISKKLLNYTQGIIESFITWGQYENITKYFFDKPISQKTLKNYNRLMTYKIADLLLANEYVVPMKTVSGMSIPRIEISNYVNDKKLQRELGDIDVMFYSKYTKTLYLIEYKNYQMMVSRERDLESEVSKVSRENTPEKVYKRQNYISNNIKYCQEFIFERLFEILDIKSIILTTKPCYYFYINKSEKYEYMNWIEFEYKVLMKEL